MATYKVNPFKDTFTVPENAGGPLTCEACGTALRRVKARSRFTGMTADVAADFWPEAKDLILAHEAECRGGK